MSTLQDNLNLIKQEKDTKILPENIRKGVTIYNITGTMEGGTSGVKQFDSYVNMQNSSNNQNGDLALVYASTQSNFTENTQTQYITFPETVTLPSAVTDYIEIGLQPVDTSIMMDCYGELDEESFSLTVYGEGFMPRINYTSSDGIHYTRTGFADADTGNPLENPVDFRTIMKFGSSWRELQWNDAIGYFMIVGSTNYDGLFNYVSANNQYEYVLTQLNAISEDVYDKSFYNGTGKFNGTLQNITNLSIDEVKRRTNLYNSLSYLKLTENITDMNNMFYSSTLPIIPNLNITNVTNTCNMFYFCTNLTTIPNFDTSNVVDMSNMFYRCKNLIDIPIFNMNNTVLIENMYYACNNLSNTSLNNIANSLPNANQLNTKMVSICGIFSNKFDNFSKNVLFNKGYLDCDTNTTGWSTEYNINGTLYSRGIDFDRYGINLNNYIPNVSDISINSSNGDDPGILLNLRIFENKNLIKNINLNINTSNVINADSTFNGCINLSNVSDFDTSNAVSMNNMFRDCRVITSIPNFSTSNVTSMCNMFTSCGHLLSVSNFDTSNTQYMSGMFMHCTNLLSVPNFDTSNVINMVAMLEYCENLTVIPNFNTSNVISMMSMLTSCKKLTTIPNFDTSNVIDMRSMVSLCYNLTDLPELNTNKVCYISDLVRGCNNLSNASIQNIINMCLNSNITNSTLMNLKNTNSYSPFMLTKFDNSYYQNRWSELTSAGWTY